MASEGYLPPIVVQITGDVAGLIEKLGSAKGLLKEFSTTDTEAPIDINEAEFAKQLASVRAQLLAFSKVVTALPVELEAKTLFQEIGALHTILQNDLGDLNLETISEVSAGIRGLKGEIDQLQTGLLVDNGEIDALLRKDFNYVGSMQELTTNANMASTDALIAILKSQQVLDGLQNPTIASSESASLSMNTGGQSQNPNDPLVALLTSLGGRQAGAALANAGVGVGLLHTLHLFTPEIVGFLTAISSVAIGLGVLGVASIGAASDIAAGTSAVSSAQNAIKAAIPGTTQWQKGVTSLGAAWSTIPANLQPAVSAINNFMQGLGKSPMATEIQGFLGGQAQILTHLFSSGGSTFAPLILATQRAIVTIENMISKGLGSGGLTRFVASISKMVGPAMVELAQLVGAIFHIAVGFAKAVQAGRGMEVLVGLFQDLANIVNSSFFQGFVSGWVDVDRLISTAIGFVIRVIGYLSNLGVNLQDVGVVVGAVTSAFMGFLAVKYLLMSMAGSTSTLGSRLSSLTPIVSKMAKSGIGLGLMATGITGLVGNITTLLHTSNPLSSLWHSIAGGITKVSNAGGGLVSTINGYTVMLNGAIPVTGNFKGAVDLLVRSEQSIGSSLSSAATGFSKFTVQTPAKVSAMIANLQAQNGSLATWAADAQILIKRGMDPSAVASLAQQAPQDLSTMVTATTSQLQSMNVQWQAKMIEAKMSGQQGVQGMITAIEQGLSSGSPVLVAAAKSVATTLGNALHMPFTGSVSSIKAIGKALNNLSPSTIAILAGKTTGYSVAANDAAAKTTKLKSASQSTGSTLLAMVPNLAMTVGGFAMLKGSLGGVFGGLRSLAGTIGESITGLLGLGGAAEAAGVGGDLLGGGFDVAAAGAAAFDAVPIVALIVAIIAVVVLLVVGIYELVTHWRTVWKDVEKVAGGAIRGVQKVLSGFSNWFSQYKGEISVVMGAIGTIIKGGMTVIKVLWSIGWEVIKTVVSVVWDTIAGTVKMAFDLISGIISVVLDVLTGHWSRAWHDLLTTVIQIGNALVGMVKSIFSALYHFVDWIWQQISSSTVAAWHQILQFLSGIGGAILHVFDGMNNLLVHAGMALLNGFLSGIKSAWKAVTGFVGGIGSWIAAHKGPISTDAVLLVPHGQAIMKGFTQGITTSSTYQTLSSYFLSLLASLSTLLTNQIPSFTKIGVALMQGLAQGLQTGSLLAIKAAQEAIQQIGVASMQASMRAQDLGGSMAVGSGMGTTGNIVINQAPITINAPTGNGTDIARAFKAAMAQHDQQLIAMLRTGSSSAGAG